MGENELMTMSRRQHSGEFKAKVVLEALRGERTITELAAAYGVHPLQITQWKRLALEELPTRLSRRRGTKPKDEDALKAVLYQQLGQLNVALDGLKKTTVVKLTQPADL
jgi:transposase-like protein